MNQKTYRFKSEERDRKLASFIMLLIAFAFLAMAIFKFVAAYNQYQLGNDLETQVDFVLGSGLIVIFVFIVVMIKLWARHASKHIILDDNDPDIYFH